jgi:hypothetical protein
MPGMRSIEPAEPASEEPMEVPIEPSTPLTDPKDLKGREPMELRLWNPEFIEVKALVPIVIDIFYPPPYNDGIILEVSMGTETVMLFDGNDVNGKDVTPEELNISKEYPIDPGAIEGIRLPSEVEPEPSTPVNKDEMMPPSGSIEPKR